MPTDYGLHVVVFVIALGVEPVLLGLDSIVWYKFKQDMHLYL